MRAAFNHAHDRAEFSEYSVYNVKAREGLKSPLEKVERIPGVPLSAYTGTLGMPGETAYAGWKIYIGEKAKTSSTIFVSSAAGPVGT